MADPLYELLIPYVDTTDISSRPSLSNPTTTSYLNRITTLSLSDLTSTEPASLSQSSQSLLRSLQALSKRSYKSVTTSAFELSSLSSSLPELLRQSNRLIDAVPHLESSTSAFAEKYRKHSDSSIAVLKDRQNALLLAQHVDRISSVLDLPTLLSSAIASGQPLTSGISSSSAGSAGSSSSVNYASALDLHAHVKRLTVLYPDSPLVASISTQAEREMRLLTTNLITSLRGQGIKLAGAMRTIGWLRRVAPELDDQFLQKRQSSGRLGSISSAGSFGSGDGALGALLLVCRLASLETMLEALEPLRDLADQETAQRVEAAKKLKLPSNGKIKRGDFAAGGGQQTERYLKRYIEIFREQSFAIVSMYKSIFPSALPVPGSTDDLQMSASEDSRSAKDQGSTNAALLPLPSPLATFPVHLVDTLFQILHDYIPNVRDKAARDSLMTQVLYCAGSLGRLGGDFSMMLALLEEDLNAEDDDGDNDTGNDGEQKVEGGNTSPIIEEEWVQVMKKHRIQASRLELLASGVGTGKVSNPTRDAAPLPVS